MRFWCEQALLPGGIAAGVALDVEAGRITRVTSTSEPGTATVLPGLTRPGFANAHSHAFHRALRGRTHDQGGTFWTWRDQMYQVAATLTPESLFELARATFAEMLLAGYTVVGEFHYLHHQPSGLPYADPNAMGHALIRAAEEAGIRLTLLDTCYLAGGLDADGHRALDSVQRRLSDGSAAAWAERVAALSERELVRIGAAAHSVRAVPLADLREVADHAREHGWPLHLHLSEQPAENDAALAHYRRSPTALVTDAVPDGLTAVHGTHLTAADVDLLAAADCIVCFCPSTEADLADGIGPARELLDAGVRLCLGSDQNAIIDPFAEVRGLEHHERLRSQQRGRFTLAELDGIASANGYVALGWGGGGRLELGALADLVSVELHSVRTAGSAPEQLLLTASAADVTDVVVGGRHVVQAGKHRLGDVAGLLSEALGGLR